MVPPDRFTAGDGTPLAAQHLHGEGPTVVLLHAGVADRRAWTDIAGRLNRAGAEVVAYDRRGFGETPMPEAAFSNVDDLISVLDQVTDEPAWLVGNSQGGLIALDFALTRPERVAGLVLIAPAVSGEPDVEDDLDPATLEIVAELEAAEDADDLEEVNRWEARLWLDGPAGPEGRVSGHTRGLALEMNAIALAAVQPDEDGGDDLDAWSRLEEIQAPTTIIWGELDIPAIIDQTRNLADRLGAARAAIELPGVAHLPGLERPDLVADLVAEAIGL